MKTYIIVLVFFIRAGEPVTQAHFAESITACHQAGTGIVLAMRNRDEFEHPAYSCHMVRAPETGLAL